MTVAVTTTVLTPASSYDLTDLATVHDELNIPSNDTSNDTFLSRSISQVSIDIANYCNRVFPVESVQDYFDVQQDPYPYQTPGGVRNLQLTRWPVTAITSVTQTLALGTTVTLTEGADYLLDAAKGQLWRLNPFTGVKCDWEAVPVTVQYSGGYATIPLDLAGACLRMVTMRFKARGRDPTLVEKSNPAAGSERYWFGSAPGQKGPFPPEISGLLDGTYRVPVVA